MSFKFRAPSFFLFLIITLVVGAVLQACKKKTTGSTEGLTELGLLVYGGYTALSARVMPPEVLTFSDSDSTDVSNPPYADLCEPAATVLGNGKVLLAGGGKGACSDSGVVTNGTYIFDPSDSTWSTVGNMANDRSQFRVVTLNDGNALAIGGCAGGCSGPSEHGQYVFQTGTSVELYDATSETWSTKTSMSQQRAQVHAGVLDNDMVLVCGGNNGFSTTYNSCVRYSPSGNSWTTVGSLGTASADWRHKIIPLSGAKAFFLSPYAAGSPQVYDDSTMLWTNTSAIGEVRANAAVAGLDGTRVLVAGGNDSNSVCTTIRSSIEIYDSSTDTWSDAGDLATARSAFTATLLSNGQVLFTGGCTQVSGSCSCLTATADVEIYDPSSQVSVSLSTLNTARQVAHALLLP